MVNSVGNLNRQTIWQLRVGFSYALEALWREIERGGPRNALHILEPEWLRNSTKLLRYNQPQSVKDRFAFFTQTARLSREQTERFRDAVFEKPVED